MRKTTSSIDSFVSFLAANTFPDDFVIFYGSESRFILIRKNLNLLLSIVKVEILYIRQNIDQS